MHKRMKAAQVGKPGGDWELVERDIPKPAAGHVRVKVEACGICHSDTLVKEGLWPGLQYPRVPGHEIAGRIDAIGADITQWKEGDRVGVGWHGGHDLVCDRCRRGDFAMCVNRKVTGIDFDGGYAEFLIAPVEALAAIPDDLPAEEAGPFMCAGVTVYNALRNSGARAGEVVAVQGIGGLGHLGVQYARKMGFHTVALGRGKDKEPLARKLGAHQYIDSGAVDTVAELQKLGGARVIDRFDRLRHHAVVGRDHQHHDVGDLGAAGAHRGEGGVARGVEEGDRFVVVVDLVGADVLGDAPGLAGGDHVHFTMLVGGRMVNPVEWWDKKWMTDRVERKLQEAR